MRSKMSAQGGSASGGKRKKFLEEALKAVSAAMIVLLALLVFGPKIAVVQAKVKTLKSIKAGSITNSYLGNNAVTGGKIAEGAIGWREIASGAVGSDEIADASIANADISSGAAIEYSKLNLGSNITSANISDGTIGNVDISLTAAISSSKINFDTGINVTGGNVGIGTASPVQPFQVNDSAAYPVVVTSFGHVGIGTTDPSPYILDLQAAWGIAQIKSTTGSNSAYLLFTNSGGYASLGLERSTGASLATSSLPYATVLANGMARALQLGTNGDIKMTINSTGLVGIGTTNPTFKLDVEGSARFWNSTGGRSGVQIGTTSGSGTAIEGIGSNGTLIQEVWINYESSGNVLLGYGGGKTGIGEGSPGSKLSVSGEAAIGNSAAYSQTAAPAGGIIIQGNVGIGTTSPQSKLQVDSGYIQLDKKSGAPASADCDAAAEEGKLYWDATTDNFYICSGASGWRKVTTSAP
jgi:hypothetical protein